MAYAIGEFIGTIIAYGLFIVPIISAVLIVRNRKKGGEKRKRFIRYRLNSKGKKLVYGIILPITIIALCCMGETPSSTPQSESTTKKVITGTEINPPKRTDGLDINDIEIEYTDNGRVIITNNSKYDTTMINLTYRNTDCMVGTDGSLRSGESANVDANKYYRNGGYELEQIFVMYIDENGEEQSVFYDAVLGRYSDY